jgi:hypothetical protein
MLIDCELRTELPDHWAGQSETGNKVRSIVGWENTRWIMGRGKSLHTWRVKCTEEESTLLALISENVSHVHQTELLNEKKKLEEEIAQKLTRISEIDKQIGEI